MVVRKNRSKADFNAFLSTNIFEKNIMGKKFEGAKTIFFVIDDFAKINSEMPLKTLNI